ncbi:MAG: DoxX family membrane protein [Patescibacteria group bacterium]
MKQASFHLLRVGLAITFLWIGILILKSPEAWGGYLQPWAMELLPLPIRQMMIGTAILDIVVGVLLLVGVWTWIAAALAAFHIAVVLTVSGINAITVRDIGLLAGALAVLSDTYPKIWPRKRQ